MRSTVAPIQVRHALGWWRVTCRPCGASLINWSGDWESTIAYGLGHLSLKHPQWPRVTTEDVLRTFHFGYIIDNLDNGNGSEA